MNNNNNNNNKNNNNNNKTNKNRPEITGQAEVGYPDVAALIEEYVGRLQVPVYNKPAENPRELDKLRILTTDGATWMNELSHE